MTTSRIIRSQNIVVQICDWCGKSHDFPIEVLLEYTPIMGLILNTPIKKYDIVVKCPNTDKNLIISVPIPLCPSEKVIHVQPKDSNEKLIK